ARTSGCVSSASTHSLSPWTRLKTPAGRPASVSSSASRTAVSGTFSEGFNTKVLPQARATGNIHKGTIAGKLNGVMPAQTPTGWRLVSQSTLPAMLGRHWPMTRLGTPQANSIISTPRCTGGRPHGAVHVARRAERHSRDDAAAGGVVDVTAARGRALLPAPGKQHRYLFHGLGRYRGHGGLLDGFWPHSSSGRPFRLPPCPS